MTAFRRLATEFRAAVFEGLFHRVEGHRDTIGARYCELGAVQLLDALDSSRAACSIRG